MQAVNTQGETRCYEGAPRLGGACFTAGESRFYLTEKLKKMVDENRG